jgi:hypothetical protein
MKLYFIALILFITSGCMSNININTIKSWEGRYETKKDIVNAITNMNLDKNESVWILSNSTMKRLLKQ